MRLHSLLDELRRRSVLFISQCSDSDCHLLNNIVRYSLLCARAHTRSTIGRNMRFCSNQCFYISYNLVNEKNNPESSFVLYRGNVSATTRVNISVILEPARDVAFSSEGL